MKSNTNNDEHERARKLIALAGFVADPESSNTWLAAHLENCASCRAFAESAAETIQGLRRIPIAAGRSLISATQMRVRRRALELQRHRERIWMVSISCIAVSLCGLLSAVALWRGFEWLGSRAQLAPSIWQVGFLVFCVLPALGAAIFMLSRNTHLADHVGSYQG